MDIVPKLSKKLRSQLLKNSKWKLSLIGCAVTLAITLLLAAIVLLVLRRGKESSSNKTKPSIRVVLKSTEAENNFENGHTSTEGQRTNRTTTLLRRTEAVDKIENDYAPTESQRSNPSTPALKNIENDHTSTTGPRTDPTAAVVMKTEAENNFENEDTSTEGQRRRTPTTLGRVGAVSMNNDNAAIYSSKKAENQRANISTEHTFNLLHFEENGDIGRVTVQRHNSTTIITVLEGIIVGDNEDTYIFLQRNHSQAVIVDVLNDRVMVLSSPNHVESLLFTMRTIHTSTLSAWNSSGFKDIIQIELGARIPLILTREGPDGENITIQTNADTTIFEHRHSGDAKLLLRKRRNVAAGDPQEETLWEEMLIRPQMLNVSVVNSRGRLDFHNEKAVHIRSHLQGNVSGSASFEHKFGRMSNENGTIDVDFAVDKYGKIRITNRRAGTELWWRPKPFRGGTKTANNHSLWLSDERFIFNSEETLRIDMEREIVAVSNANETDVSMNGSRWRTWSAPFVRVEMGKNGSGETMWDVLAEEGAFIASKYGQFELRSAAGDTVFMGKKDCHAHGIMGTALTGRGYYADIFKTNANIGVKLVDSTFNIRADVGSVVVANESATITSLSATVSFKPYTT